MVCTFTEVAMYLGSPCVRRCQSSKAMILSLMGLLHFLWYSSVYVTDLVLPCCEQEVQIIDVQQGFLTKVLKNVLEKLIRNVFVHVLL